MAAIPLLPLPPLPPLPRAPIIANLELTARMPALPLTVAHISSQTIINWTTFAKWIQYSLNINPPTATMDELIQVRSFIEEMRFLRGVAESSNQMLILRDQMVANHAATQAQVGDLQIQLAAAQAEVVALRNEMVANLAAAHIAANHAGPPDLQSTVWTNDPRKVHNSMAFCQTLTTIPLEKLLNAAGLPVPVGMWFPATPSALSSATRAELDPLLGFYGLPIAGNKTEKLIRLSQHLGDLRT